MARDSAVRFAPGQRTACYRPAREFVIGRGGTGVDLDWRRFRAVVLQSDDWGLCAWVPDDRAHRALAELPAFRTPAGLRYGRSTLESAADVRDLARSLASVRGADGLPPVLQANTILANPDPRQLIAPLFEAAALPLTAHPDQPPRWQRPGLWETVRLAEREGVWWAELHGLHHLPAGAWLAALRRGDADARLAFEHGSPVCRAVEASGEFDAAEPRALREAGLREAAAGFERLFGRRPASFCPPDYRHEDALVAEAASLGITTFQGASERHGVRFARARRWLAQRRFPRFEGTCLISPPRIAFEPRGEAAAGGPVGVEAARRHARSAWERGQPAIVSTHRLNYAHLDPQWSSAGRRSLATLLSALAADGARFVTDSEVSQLASQGWSVRAGRDHALIRNPGGPRREVRFAVPATATGLRIAGPAGEGAVALQSEAGTAEARVGEGEHRIDWESA